jgi:hypothetical protein
LAGCAGSSRTTYFAGAHVHALAGLFKLAYVHMRALHGSTNFALIELHVYVATGDGYILDPDRASIDRNFSWRCGCFDVSDDLLRDGGRKDCHFFFKKRANASEVEAHAGNEDLHIDADNARDDFLRNANGRVDLAQVSDVLLDDGSRLCLSLSDRTIGAGDLGGFGAMDSGLLPKGGAGEQREYGCCND